MGFATIRTAIATFLQDALANGSLPSIASVSAAPQAINSSQVFANLANTSSGSEPGIGAVVWVYLSDSISQLYAPPVNYADQFTCDLIVLTLDPSGNAINAQTISDNALDELKRLIKTNRTANSANTIFTWGVGPALNAGHPDISISQDLPELVGKTAILVPASIKVVVNDLTPQQ